MPLQVGRGYLRMPPAGRSAPLADRLTYLSTALARTNTQARHQLRELMRLLNLRQVEMTVL
jgi:hypothetical protein